MKRLSLSIQVIDISEKIPENCLLGLRRGSRVVKGIRL